MEWQNELTALLKVQYPIIQAPMLGVSTPEMAAAVSNAGGLGSVAIGGLPPSQVRTLIHQTRALTHKPFAVNFFAHEIMPVDPIHAGIMADFLFNMASQHRLPAARTDVQSLRFFSYRDQMEVLLEEKVPVVSFTFGIPDDNYIAAFKAAGVVLIGTATSTKEAMVLDQRGIDVITAQGIEAGGHRGTFLEHEPLPMVGVMSLVPAVVGVTRKPVVAAGGIYNGHTVKAALQLGALGVQPGTAFIASDESNAIPSYKTALLAAGDTDTTLTRAFSGRWARGIRNHFMQLVEDAGIPMLPYPVQNALVAPIRAAAQKADDNEFVAMWAGQSANKSLRAPAAVILAALVEQTEAL